MAVGKEVQATTGFGPERERIPVVGIHGILRALRLAESEGSDSIVASACEAVPSVRRVDTYPVATDSPPQKLALSLRIVLPNLKFLSIDSIHLSFAVSRAFAAHNTRPGNPALYISCARMSPAPSPRGGAVRNLG